MNEEQSHAIIDKALTFASADEIEVSLGETTEKATRFANNAIIQSVSSHGRTVSISVAFGQKVGRATTNETSDEALRSVVERAELIARHSEPDTEYLPPPGPQSYIPVNGFRGATDQLAHEDRAASLAKAIEPCAAAGHRAAGSYTTYSSASAIGNGRGLFGFDRSTSAYYVQTDLTDDSSGWCESVSSDASRVDPSAVGRTAFSKAEAARDPATIEPGAYTVVMEPAAFAGILSIAGWTMQAKAAHEGRSAWAGREGTKVGVDDLTIRTIPAHPEQPGSAWTQQGLATRDITWLDRGKLETLIYDRFWARKSGHEVTGYPSNLIVSGTDASTADLIATVERGVLITRFWYIRFVDPMTLTITGMTRDGLFLIEDGKVTRGLKNMRFNDSPLRVFQSIRKLGKPAPTALHGPIVAPPVVVEGFHFTSQTSF